MELAIFNPIFEHRQTAGLLHRSQALSFIVLGMVIRTSGQLWTLISETVDDIRSGTFRKFLLQPISFPLYFQARVIGPKTITWIMGATALIILRRYEAFSGLLPMAKLLPFLLSLSVGMLLTWQIYLGIVYVGFWMEEVAFLSVAFNIGCGIFSGTLIPLSWLPDALQKVLWFTPLPYLGDIPVRTGLGMLSEAEWANYFFMGILWFFGLLAINSVLKHLGFRRYEAFGG